MIKAPDKRRALGRGLDALMPPVPSPPTVKRDYFVCGIEEVHPSRSNPRQVFEEAALAGLMESIRAQGVIQPLVVRNRPAAEGGGFMLIAGERRWRAAQKAGLKEVPVVVKEATAAQAFELALVENLQREDLNAIEEAEAYRRLSDEHGYTPGRLAERVGRDPSTISNTLRLLKLPASVRGMVAGGQLQAGHARTLLGLETVAAIEEAAEKVVKGGLSVRQVEALVQKARRGPPPAGDPDAGKSPNLRDLELRLERALGLRVKVSERPKGGGSLEIAWRSLDDLDRVLDRLLKP
ncbi:MAG: ParB/RepB/Spo0J family partition protein [Myxococcales bacterium]|nr:ParB/RepB/Spo0J family partition protein [Myxococcales bacterium]